MAQYHVLASEGRQRYIYTKTRKNIKEKKTYSYEALVIEQLLLRHIASDMLIVLLSRVWIQEIKHMMLVNFTHSLF
jgi:hypothetical protein